MQRPKSSSREFLEGKFPLLLPLLVNLSILFSTFLVIFLFSKNSRIPLELDNSPGNFPLGSLTAVFSPDTQVFLDFGSWKSWYVLTAANFSVFLALFLILNWNVNRRERGIRFVFYSILFVILPVVANILDLHLINQSTLGPSGAYYTTNGLLVGFGLVNLWMGDTAGGLRKMMMTTRMDAVLFILNGTVGTGVLLLSFVDPTDFFSEVLAGYNVGYGIHIFCFYSAAALALMLGYSRRSKLAVVIPKLSSKDADDSA